MADGYIKKIQDNLNSAYTQYYDSSISYDATGRLKVSKAGSTVITYTYDNAGNRTAETIGGTNNSLSYTSGTNKLSSATINSTSYTYSHDDVGNVTQKTWGGSNQTDYVYNYANLLAQVTLNGSRTVTNYYGGGGATRVKKTDSQLGSRYYGPLSEHDSTGAIKKKYIYALGKCIAFVDSANGKHWMHQDAQGSTKLITNASGTAENAYKYYPFGDSLNFTGTVKNDVKFTGQRYADGIEAYDFNARYYDPELGRFYSRDPMGSAATSPYAYCGNNPVNFTDPSGMVALPFNPDMVGGPGGGGDAVTSPTNWALMSMSSARWTKISPDYSRWRQNEIDSYWTSEYRNRADYDVTNADGTHTYTFWNVVTQSGDKVTYKPGPSIISSIINSLSKNITLNNVRTVAYGTIWGGIACSVAGPVAGIAAAASGVFVAQKDPIKRDPETNEFQYTLTNFGGDFLTLLALDGWINNGNFTEWFRVHLDNGGTNGTNSQ